MKTPKLNIRFLSTLLSSLLAIGCSSLRPNLNFDQKLYGGDATDLQAIDTKSKVLRSHKKRVYRFPKASVEFSNQFPGARLNDIEKVTNDEFNIIIEAENYPINDSPWYAFRVRSLDISRSRLKLNLIYANRSSIEKGSHRYIPKLSRDGKAWKSLLDFPELAKTICHFVGSTASPRGDRAIGPLSFYGRAFERNLFS